MSSYNEFVKEATVSYQQLPQETSELYKRYYINIPFDVNAISTQNPSDKNIVDKTLASMGVKFDLILGDGTALLPQPNEFIKLQNAENSNDAIANSMHKNAEDKYVAYINANSKTYVSIDVPEGKIANVNALILGSNNPLNAIVHIRLGKSAKLNILEYYCSEATQQTTIGTIHEALMGNNSELELNALHNENANTLVLSFFKNKSEDNSHLKLNSVYLGSSQTRVRNTVDADKDHSKVEVNEIVFGSGAQKFDIGTYVVNGAPHTNAVLESKAALMDKSFCIMKGFAKINKGAAKAKSYVHERGILLNKEAKVYGLPDMSVDESDVKATHSSATAPVDEEAVFYLMTKGIDETGVRKLLVTGFFVGNIAKISNNLMKELSMSLINTKLEDKSFGAAPKMDMKNIWVSSSSQESDIFKGHYKYRGAE